VIAEPVDDGFEERLVRRIALKEALALRLNERERRLVILRLKGWTIRAIAREDGVSAARIDQLEKHAFRRLLWPWLGLRDGVPVPRAMLPEPPPRKRTFRRGPPGEFDRAAFLEHMRRLIVLRDIRRECELEREIAEEASELRDLMMREEIKQKAHKAYEPPSVAFTPPPPAPKDEGPGGLDMPPGVPSELMAALARLKDSLDGGTF
jgi:hypothetical protein